MGEMDGLLGKQCYVIFFNVLDSIGRRDTSNVVYDILLDADTNVTKSLQPISDGSDRYLSGLSCT